MLIESPAPISTTRSSESRRAAPLSTTTHSCVGRSYRKTSCDACPFETICSIQAGGALSNSISRSSKNSSRTPAKRFVVISGLWGWPDTGTA